MKPVKFILWATALNFLVFHLLGLDTEMINQLTQQQGTHKVSVQFTRYIFDHPAILIFLMIPNIAFFSWLKGILSVFCGYILLLVVISLLVVVVMGLFGPWLKPLLTQ